MVRKFSFIPALILISMTGISAAEKPMNVLFIAIDDLRDELGCYGHDHVQSPNLDRLASEGMLFINHFVHVLTCGASRYSLLTGRAPAHSGVKTGNNHFYDGPAALSHSPTPGAQSMPELFRRNGYHTVNIGKMSHTADGKVFSYNGEGDGRDEIPFAWDDKATPYGAWKRGWGVFFAYANGVHREDGSRSQDLMEFTAENDEDLPDGLNAKVAIEKLKELKDSDKPFFMGLGFYKPHLPFVAPKQDWDAVKDISAPDAPHPNKPASKYGSSSGEFFRYDFPFEKTRPLNAESRMEARRAYWACVRYVDRQVGRVLTALDDLGLRDNTIVVVWGDHGWQLGDGEMWAKHVAHERALKSTLIFHVPGLHQSGNMTDAIVQTTDLYPTLVDLCELKDTKTEFPLDGRSLRNVLDGSRSKLHDSVVGYWRNSESIRNENYRLIASRTPTGFENIELYDIRTTRDPLQNIADENPDIVRELLNALPETSVVGKRAIPR